MGDEIPDSLFLFVKSLNLSSFLGSSEEGPGLLSEELDSWVSSSSRNSRNSESLRSENPEASGDTDSSSPVSVIAQFWVGESPGIWLIFLVTEVGRILK